MSEGQQRAVVTQVVWAGGGPVAEVGSLFERDGLTLVAAGNETPAETVAAIVWADGDHPAPIIRALKERSPGLHVLAATRQLVPEALLAALDAGAAGILELCDPESFPRVAARIRDLHKSAVRERELLVRLRTLNDDFLKNMIALEKRNIELQEQLQSDVQPGGDATGKVLVVDDEEAVGELFRLVLTERGFQVTALFDGESAMESVRQNAFELVVTDKNLPGKDGLELLQQIKAMRPETVVVMITGYGSKESAIEALNRGASAFLEKPFDDISVIVDRLTELLSHKQQENKSRRYLQMIKERNRSFLEQYRIIRNDLEYWLQHSALSSGPDAAEQGGAG